MLRKSGYIRWNSSSPYQTIDSDDRYFGQSVALNKDGTKLIVGSKPLTPTNAARKCRYTKDHTQLLSLHYNLKNIQIKKE